MTKKDYTTRLDKVSTWNEFWFRGCGRSLSTTLVGRWDVVLNTPLKVMLVSAEPAVVYPSGHRLAKRTRGKMYCVLTGVDLDVGSSLEDVSFEDGVVESRSIRSPCRFHVTEFERFEHWSTPTVIETVHATMVLGGPDVVSIQRQLETLLDAWHGGLVGARVMMEQAELMWIQLEAQLDTHDGPLWVAVTLLGSLNVHIFLPQDAPLFLDLIGGDAPDDVRLAEFERDATDYEMRAEVLSGDAFYAVGR